MSTVETAASAAVQDGRPQLRVIAGGEGVEPAREGLLESKEGAAWFRYGALVYHLRGIRPRLGGSLRLAIRVFGEGGGTVRDLFELYSQRAREAFAVAVGERMHVDAALVEQHLETIVDEIEAIQVRERKRLEEGEATAQKVLISDVEKEEALELLRAPDLFERIVKDVDRLGYVGEPRNKKIAYLVATSRKTSRPLSAIIRAGSGAGKSRLMEVVAELMPPEDVEFFSRITPQSLYYMGKGKLANKLLIIDERVGGEDADYSIRSLQTRKKLTLATPMKDPVTGKMATMTFTVEGPVAFMESTTSPTINAENANRCFELYLDESEAQTRKIQEAQREQYRPVGWAAEREREAILRRHWNAQRLLEPVRVAIPFSGKLRFPSRWLRARRDHERFLGLVAMVAFVRQHSRNVRKDESGDPFIEATAEDYREAFDLAEGAIREALDDLAKPARELLVEIKRMVEARALEAKAPAHTIVFTRRQLREFAGLPNRQVLEGLKELVDLEEIIAIGGLRQGSRYEYRLAGDGARPPADPLMGLTGPDDLGRILASEAEAQTLPKPSPTSPESGSRKRARK